jgi:hypothetical protein
VPSALGLLCEHNNNPPSLDWHRTSGGNHLALLVIPIAYHQSVPMLID